MKKLLITVCGRAGSKGFKNKNLKTFCDKPLVYYSLAAANLFLAAHPEVQADIALNTDSQELAELVAAKYPEVVFLPRCEALGGDTVPKMEVIQDSLTRMEQARGFVYDYVMDLDITSPLRTAQDLANAYEMKAARDDLQLVYSATESRRNPCFNMVKDCGDHIERGIGDVWFATRQQAPSFFDVNASIYVYERDFLAGNATHNIWDARTYVTLMMDTGILDIDSEEDFLLMEVIARHLYSHYEAFGQVREAIRG